MSTLLTFDILSTHSQTYPDRRSHLTTPPPAHPTPHPPPPPPPPPTLHTRVSLLSRSEHKQYLDALSVLENPSSPSFPQAQATFASLHPIVQREQGLWSASARQTYARPTRYAVLGEGLPTALFALYSRRGDLQREIYPQLAVEAREGGGGGGGLYGESHSIFLRSVSGHGPGRASRGGGGKGPVLELVSPRLDREGEERGEVAWIQEEVSLDVSALPGWLESVELLPPVSQDEVALGASRGMDAGIVLDDATLRLLVATLGDPTSARGWVLPVHVGADGMVFVDSEIVPERTQELHPRDLNQEYYTLALGAHVLGDAGVEGLEGRRVYDGYLVRDHRVLLRSRLLGKGDHGVAVKLEYLQPDEWEEVTLVEAMDWVLLSWLLGNAPVGIAHVLPTSGSVCAAQVVDARLLDSVPGLGPKMEAVFDILASIFHTLRSLPQGLHFATHAQSHSCMSIYSPSSTPENTRPRSAAASIAASDLHSLMVAGAVSARIPYVRPRWIDPSRIPYTFKIDEREDVKRAALIQTDIGYMLRVCDRGKECGCGYPVLTPEEIREMTSRFAVVGFVQSPTHAPRKKKRAKKKKKKKSKSKPKRGSGSGSGGGGKGKEDEVGGGSGGGDGSGDGSGDEGGEESESLSSMSSLTSMST